MKKDMRRVAGVEEMSCKLFRGDGDGDSLCRVELPSLLTASHASRLSLTAAAPTGTASC
jgi:hypothetical protein